MNLGQALDPEWVQGGARRRPFERTAPLPQLVAAEQGEQARVAAQAAVVAEASEIATRQAQEEALQRAGARRREERAEDVRRQALAAAERQARASAVERKAARRKRRQEESKSLALLRVLNGLSRPLSLAALHDMVPGVSVGSLAAFLSSFVVRSFAVRYGVRREYRYAIGAKGRQYLKMFHQG